MSGKAKSKADLLSKCREGSMLEDFFYRINDFPLTVPPLRERPEDIRLLAEHYLAIFSREMNKEIVGFSDEAVSFLESCDWHKNIRRIEGILATELSACRNFSHTADVRTLGAIGVVELRSAVDMESITRRFVEAGVWIRPFGRLIYLMPPYIIEDSDLRQLCHVICETVEELSQ